MVRRGQVQLIWNNSEDAVSYIRSLVGVRLAYNVDLSQIPATV